MTVTKSRAELARVHAQMMELKARFAETRQGETRWVNAHAQTRYQELERAYDKLKGTPEESEGMKNGSR